MGFSIEISLQKCKNLIIEIFKYIGQPGKTRVLGFDGSRWERVFTSSERALAKSKIRKSILKDFNSVPRDVVLSQWTTVRVGQQRTEVVVSARSSTINTRNFSPNTEDFLFNGESNISAIDCGI